MRRHAVVGGVPVLKTRSCVQNTRMTWGLLLAVIVVLQFVASDCDAKLIDIELVLSCNAHALVKILPSLPLKSMNCGNNWVTKGATTASTRSAMP